MPKASILGPRQAPATWRRRLLGIAGWVVLLSAWSGLTYGKFVQPGMLPSPTALAKEFHTLAVHGFTGTPLWIHVGVSVGRTLTGFLAAVVLGVPLGLAMGYYETVGDLVGSILSFLRPIPPIAYIPLAVLYFGIGNASKVILIFFGAFLFVVLNTQAGVIAVPRILIRAGQNAGLTQMQLFRHVILPGALPSIMSGIRTALAIAWALVVAAELIAAQSGLGYMIEEAATFFHLDVVYVGIILIGIIGMTMDFIVLYIQRRVLHWQGQ